MASGSVGNFFMARVVPAFVVATASTTTAPYIAANVLNWMHPPRFWMSTTNSSDQQIVLDLSSLAAGAQYVGVYLRCNFAVGTLMANDFNIWTAPPVTVPLTVLSDPFLTSTATGEIHRHGLFFFNVARTPFPCRYMLLTITGGQGTDDAGLFKVYNFVPLMAPIEFEARTPWTIGRRRTAWSNELPQGDDEIMRAGRRRVFIRAPWDFFMNPLLGATGTEESAMYSLLVDEDEAVVVCRDLNRPHQSYLCTRKGEIEWQSREGIGVNFPLEFAER